MGWLGDILGTIGDVGKYAAIPLGLSGIGAPLAAGIGAAGGLLGKLNDEDQSLGSIAKGGLGGAAMGAGGAAGGSLLGGGSFLGGGGGGLKGALGSLGSAIKGDPMQALQLGGAGLSAIEGSRQQDKVNKLIEEEMARIRAQQDSRLPYQDMLQQSLEGQMGNSGELGAIYGQSQNPFAQGQIPPEALGQLPGATQPTAPQRPWLGGGGGYQDTRISR